MKLNFKNSRKNSAKIVVLLALITAFMSGCESAPKYYWGNYESLIYTQAQQPGRATPEVQIEKLEADIQKAASKNQPLPPGFYAHLAYQYIQIGKAGEARKYFAAEKAAYPESAVLMNRFLKKIK
jgi:hypothetical protein